MNNKEKSSFLANIKIGKYNLPKILSGISFIILKVASSFANLLIRNACKLEPENIILEQNRLKILQLVNSLGLKKSYFYKICVHKYLKLKDSYLLYAKKVLFTQESQIINIKVPSAINKLPGIGNKEGPAQIPNTYLIEIDKINIFGGTDIILKDNICLYDEIDSNEYNVYGVKSPVIAKVSKNYLFLYHNLFFTPTLEKGIHLLKDHSKNYFHWLIECLPRLLLLEKANIPLDVPLLVDNNLAPQAYEALKLFNNDKREIKLIDFKKKYLVNKLYYPSQLSIIHDNYSSPVNYYKDVIYSPKAISYVRDTILHELNLSPIKGFRKLYISRKGSGYRILSNAIEVEELLISHGFEIIFPEKLSFKAQVEVFSQAKMIIGQSGAGLANMIFAPSDSKVLVMMSDHKQTNLNLFDLIAQMLCMKCDHILGEVDDSRANSFQSDFKIDLGILKSYLEKNL